MKINNTKKMTFLDAFYSSECSICGEELQWEVNIEHSADLEYTSECCDIDYYMKPLVMEVGKTANNEI